MIKLGVIGLGEVSQLMHLPILQDLVSDYKVTAISDVSVSLVDFVAKKYSIKDTYLDAVELIQNADIDAILVLSPDQYHGLCIKEALKAGKHVFVEKPVALCKSELEEIIKMKKDYPNQTVMVGYMRRYTATYLKAKELLQADNKPVEYLRMRDNILEGPFYIGQTRPIFYPSDVPQNIIEEGGQRKRAQLDLAIGADATDAQRKAYQMLAGLGCHTLSAARELFGNPKTVKSVTTNCGGEQMVIVFEYDGFMGIYELVNNQNFVDFDASIEIFQGYKKTKIKYETPYIRYQPVNLQVIDSTDNDTKTLNYGPYYVDPFQTELLEFSSCVKENKAPKTTLEDARGDFELFEEIIRVMGKDAK